MIRPDWDNSPTGHCISLHRISSCCAVAVPSVTSLSTCLRSASENRLPSPARLLNSFSLPINTQKQRNSHGENLQHMQRLKQHYHDLTCFYSRVFSMMNISAGTTFYTPMRPWPHNLYTSDHTKWFKCLWNQNSKESTSSMPSMHRQFLQHNAFHWRCAFVNVG